MNPSQAKIEINLAREALNRAELALGDAPVPSATVVRAGENLQAALEGAGTINVEPNTTFEGCFFLRPNTALVAPGVTLRGSGGPALFIAPGTTAVSVDGPTLLSDYQAVFDIGVNTLDQTRPEQMPSNIILRRINIPTHRRKRGLSVHARTVLVEDSEIVDIYDTSPSVGDSQAIYIQNTSGDIQIRRNRLSAGSEPILIGGDTNKIPGLVPDNIIIEDNDIFRPMEWQTDGIQHKVKNLIETKTGRNVMIRRNKIHGCWKHAQQGEAFMLTPTRDGIVQNVTIEDNEIWDCSSGINALGGAYSYFTPEQQSGLIVRRNTWKLSAVLFGGRGQLLIIGAGFGTIQIEGNVVEGDGTSTIYSYTGDVMLGDGTLVDGGKIRRLEILGNQMRLGTYGFNMGGVQDAKAWAAHVEAMVVSGNTFTGSHDMKTIFPENVYQ